MTQEAITLDPDDSFANLGGEQPQIGGGYEVTLVAGSGAFGENAPTIDNFDPSPGTPIDRNQLIAFDVKDDTGLLRAEIFVTLGSDTFVVHDGEKFRGRFTNFSSRTAITGGFRYSVRPNGGWTSPPLFEVHAVDTAGQEAT